MTLYESDVELLADAPRRLSDLCRDSLHSCDMTVERVSRADQVGWLKIHMRWQGRFGSSHGFIVVTGSNVIADAAKTLDIWLDGFDTGRNLP